MKDYTKIYTIIFWLSMLSILLWVILKAAGVINTPTIIELFLIIGAIFGAGVFYQMLLDIKTRLTKLESGTYRGFKDVRKDIYNLDKRVSIIEAKI